MRIKSKSRLLVSSVKKAFRNQGDTTQVIANIDFELRDGEFVSIFGPNGCGKTSLLNLINGMIEPDAGFIKHSTDRESRVGMVFQNYDKTLLPWRRCIDNIILPLESNNNLSKKDRRDRAVNVVNELGLKLPLNNYPHEMSGGQKQLTSLARAMVAKPSLLLLDEPFASLDYQTRTNMQKSVQNVWMKSNVSTILVSHEVDEALFLSDRLLLLSPKPSSIAAEYIIDFPRPRNLETMLSSSFISLRSTILQKFNELVDS